MSERDGTQLTLSASDTEITSLEHDGFLTVVVNNQHWQKMCNIEGKYLTLVSNSFQNQKPPEAGARLDFFQIQWFDLEGQGHLVKSSLAWYS